MAQQNYQVRLTADTKSAADKLDAVQSQLDSLTKKPRDITVGVDANALRRSVEDTERVAKNVRAAATDLKAGSSTNFISGSTLSSAASLASTFYGIRKDAKGLGQDLAKSVSKTNISEFMRTEKFLDRVLENSRAKSRDIVETYANIREVPGAANLLGPVENFARAKAFERYGDEIAKQTLDGVKQGLQQGVQETKNFLYGDLFNDIKAGTARTIDTLGRLGLAIQGVQLLIGPLAAAWSAAFDAIIGQNIRLEQTILSTQTTLASTGRVIDKSTGKELLDPLQKIQALEGDVRGAIENIRVRSLDLAGVTSQQIIDIFGVVATSISQVNGNIKDAEDLAISFTAAMGTLGIPFYQARQEIGSILGGYITEDSLLAKRLQISNADIQKAKNSVDGVVGYLKKKLETAVAGQAISAKGFAGVMSNIQEVFEVIAQRIGQPLLGPLVAGLTAVYEFLKKIQGVVTEVGGYISGVIAKTITSIVNIFRNSKLAESIGGSIQALAQPYQDLARSVQLGLSDSGNLIERWVNGIEAVPRAFQGVVAALQGLGNFLKLQIELISEPLTQLLDQSRDLADGWIGVIQRITRIASIPFGNVIELSDTFTKGWDTITSTIQAAGAAIAKFGIALIRLKITEFTAQIRAAAKVFEVFGSVILARLNLAIAVFDTFGSVLGSDFAKFFVSLTAINRLINNTDFFGVKGIVIWAAQTRVIFQQLLGDIRLFAKGFKDAGNVDNLIKNAQAATAKVFSTQVKSDDPVLRNAAQVEQLTKKLRELETAQTKVAQASGAAAAAEKYASSIKKLEDNLAAAKKTQEGFTQAQRAAAAIKSFMGGGAELAQAKEAARQASVMASGAASAQALNGVIDTLAQRLGLTREQMKTLGGATQAATRSLQTFLTTSMLINIGFTAASLLISAGISAWQQYEESVKTARMEALRMAQVQKILSSGYQGIARAAEGGDVAAQRKLQEAQEQANAAMQIQQEKRNKLLEKEAKLNDEIYGLRELQKRDLQAGSSTAGYAELARLERERTKNKKEQEEIDKRIYQISLAQQRVQQEANIAKEYTVLAERRKDLEEKIKTVREDYEKELSDKAFQTRMELLSIEQQKRREIQDQELKALRERFQLLSNNATDQDKRTLALVQDYQVALLEAANAEQNARAEFIQKEQQLRKEIEDYAFKMQRERINLEKQVGAYQKQVEEYKNRQQENRIQKELSALRQQQKLQGVYFQPYNVEQQQGFVNKSQGLRDKFGLNTQDLYALLQITPKDTLGISGTERIETIFAKLDAFLSQLLKAGQSRIDVVGLAQKWYPGVDAKDLVSKLRAESVSALNTSQWFQKRDDKSVATPNLTIDWAGMNARVRQYQFSLVKATAELTDLLIKGARKEAEAAFQRLSDPSNFTDIKSSYATDLESANTAFEISRDAVLNFGDVVNSTADEMKRADTLFRNRVTALLNSTGLKPDKVADVNKTIAAGGNIRDALTKAGLGKTSAQFIESVIVAFRKGLSTAKRQIKDNAPERDQANTLNQLTEVNNNILGRMAEAKASALPDAFGRLNEALKASTSATYSYENAQKRIASEVQVFVMSELGKVKGQITPDKLAGVLEAAQSLEATLLLQEKALAGFNSAIEDYTARLNRANQMTETYISGLKQSLFDIATSGKSVSEAMQALLESVAQEMTRSVIDIVVEPLREQALNQFKRIFGVTSAEERMRDELKKAQEALKGAVEAQTAAVNTNTSEIRSLNSTIQVAALEAKSPPTSSSTPTNAGGAYSDADIKQAGADLANDLINTQQEAEKVKDSAKNVSKGLTNMQKTISGLVQGFASIAMGVAGFDQIKKGGTYNTLMGLAGIFGAIGGITGMFGTGGIFGPSKKAAGGPVSRRMPYLVGETGPELFIPDFSGQIIPSDPTQRYLANGDTSDSPENDLRYAKAEQFGKELAGSTNNTSNSANNIYSKSSASYGGDANSSSSSSSYITNSNAQSETSISNSDVRYTRGLMTAAALPAPSYLRQTSETVNNSSSSTERLVEQMATRSTKLEFAYESTVINNVEYVTADQFRKGLSDAAERGRALTLGSLKNSVKARRGVGL